MNVPPKHHPTKKGIHLQQTCQGDVQPIPIKGHLPTYQPLQITQQLKNMLGESPARSRVVRAMRMDSRAYCSAVEISVSSRDRFGDDKQNKDLASGKLT